MSNFKPVAYINYEIPQGLPYALADEGNPVITIIYEDGSKHVFDTNKIYHAGFRAGEKSKQVQIRLAMGL